MLQVVKEELCHYDSFIKEITDKVKENMGEKYSVRIYKVTKNNSLELDSLVILKNGINFAPNLYLLPYYEAYIQGTCIKELAERLCNVYHSNNTPVMDDSFSFSFEKMKSSIVYRLVSYERNKKLLNDIPHIKYLDLAITFHCLVREDSDGIGTIRITNEHMKIWNTSIDELYQLAILNTKTIFSPVIKSMDDVIMGMLGNDAMYKNDEDLLNDFTDSTTDNNYNLNQHKMYILTNYKGINGASCLLYHNILKQFSDQINSDFFILPSSIHEVILVPFDKTITKEALTEMVKDVNYTQVARDEVLSDRVYYYSRQKDSISI